MDVHKSIELYQKKIFISDVTRAMKTQHVKKERMKRLNKSLELNRFSDGKMANIDRVFDAAYEDGRHTLYVVTKRGIMFLFDKEKFEMGYPSMITAYPGQLPKLFYLYRACGLDVPHQIITSVKRWNKST